MAEVGCKKAAAANEESVFSGAGKFTEEAKSAGEKIMADSPVANVGKTGKKPSVPSFTLEEEL